MCRKRIGYKLLDWEEIAMDYRQSINVIHDAVRNAHFLSKVLSVNFLRICYCHLNVPVLSFGCHFYSVI